MVTFPTPTEVAPYWEDAFNLKDHLRGFLSLDADALDARLKKGQDDLAELGHRDFNWDEAKEFYKDKVGEAYLFDLGAWHLTSKDYIGDTLRLIVDYAKGDVLDFGGGIGTHSIAATCCPEVKSVTYCDINPISRDFVQYRTQQLQVQDTLSCQSQLADDALFDTIICFDVIEHLPDPVQQLHEFKRRLKPSGMLIINWYFFKGTDGEFPFHLDDPAIIETFFKTLQSNFVEVFHPYTITVRCYRSLDQ